MRTAPGGRNQNLKSFGWLLASPALIAGVPTLLLNEIAVDVFKAIASALGGEPPDDPEEAFYEWMHGTFGIPGNGSQGAVYQVWSG